MRKPASCLVLVLAALLSACMPGGVVKDRLDVIREPASCQPARKALVVLLPGMYDTPSDLVREGFVQALRDRRIAADVVAADTHFGYFRSRTVVDRLHADIVQPAREAGYGSVWLAGISLGGFGSLLYAQAHGERVDGIFLMAPYLGEERIFSEIDAVGGLANWHAAQSEAAEHERDLWRWLQTYTRKNRPAGAYPPLYLGFGKSDRFARGNGLLADALPATHVFTTAGGHDWAPWRRLWAAFLDRGLLPACA